MDAKTVLVEQMTRATKVFLKTLEEFPEDKFHSDLPSGGNSVAWNALHLADWAQILVPSKLENVDTNLKFAYLGWEDADFAKAVFGLGNVTVQSRNYCPYQSASRAGSHGFGGCRCSTARGNSTNPHG
jgi:hypothetical protein